MNIKEYIASGILESYVLGGLTAAQNKEVEQMAEKHPEVSLEIEQIRQVFEQIAMSSARTPRPALKQEILDTINNQDQPGAINRPSLEAKATHKEEKQRRFKNLPWLMVAASAVFAVISAIAAANYYMKWQDAEQELDAVIAQNQSMAQDYNRVNQQFERAQNELNIVSSPEYNIVKMEGLPLSPESQAIIYWNESTQDVYLNVKQLPAPPQDKQYQLWAIVDGAPVDAGVFELAEGEDGLLKMKSIANASAFAVTLEPRGGLPAPTMDAMFVLGTVNEA